MRSTGFWAIFIHRLPVIWGFSRMKHLTTESNSLMKHLITHVVNLK